MRRTRGRTEPQLGSDRVDGGIDRLETDWKTKRAQTMALLKRADQSSEHCTIVEFMKGCAKLPRTDSRS